MILRALIEPYMYCCCLIPSTKCVSLKVQLSQSLRSSLNCRSKLCNLTENKAPIPLGAFSVNFNFLHVSCKWTFHICFWIRLISAEIQLKAF